MGFMGLDECNEILTGPSQFQKFHMTSHMFEVSRQQQESPCWRWQEPQEHLEQASVRRGRCVVFRFYVRDICRTFFALLRVLV